MTKLIKDMKLHYKINLSIMIGIIIAAAYLDA